MSDFIKKTAGTITIAGMLSIPAYGQDIPPPHQDRGVTPTAPGHMNPQKRAKARDPQKWEKRKEELRFDEHRVAILDRQTERNLLQLALNEQAIINEVKEQQDRRTYRAEKNKIQAQEEHDWLDLANEARRARYPRMNAGQLELLAKKDAEYLQIELERIAEEAGKFYEDERTRGIPVLGSEVEPIQIVKPNQEKTKKAAREIAEAEHNNYSPLPQDTMAQRIVATRHKGIINNYRSSTIKRG